MGASSIKNLIFLNAHVTVQCKNMWKKYICNPDVITD